MGKIFSTFMKPKRSLPFWKIPTTGCRCEPDDSDALVHNPLIYD